MPPTLLPTSVPTAIPTPTPTAAPAPPTYAPTGPPSPPPTELPTPAPSPMPTATPVPSRTFSPTRSRAFVDVALSVVFAFLDAGAFNGDRYARRAFADAVVAALPGVDDRSAVGDVVASPVRPTYARRLTHRQWHTWAPSSTPRPSVSPTFRPTPGPTTRFAPTFAPSSPPTTARNATRVDFYVEYLHDDAASTAAAADVLVDGSVSALRAALDDGSFLGGLLAGNGTAVYADAEILANQSYDALGEATYDVAVTTPPPSGAPTQNPTDEKLPRVPWWKEFTATGFLVAAGMTCFGSCVGAYLSVKCFHEYKGDAAKIYAEGPIYKAKAILLAKEVSSEVSSTPSYLKATSKEWVQMIVQPNKLDARDWPSRVASERRCVTDGHL